MTPRDTTKAIVAALRTRYTVPEWAFISELRLAAGWAGTDARADGWAVNCYPSKWADGAIHAFEVKATRADLRRELADPAKRAPALEVCDRFWYVLADGIAPASEIPPPFGVQRWSPNIGLRTIRRPGAHHDPETRLAGKWQMGNLATPAELPLALVASAIRSALLTEPPFNPYRGQKGRAV